MLIRIIWLYKKLASSQAKGTKSTSFLRNEVDLVPLAGEDEEAVDLDRHRFQNNGNIEFCGCEVEYYKNKA